MVQVVAPEPTPTPPKPASPLPPQSSLIAGEDNVDSQEMTQADLSQVDLSQVDVPTHAGETTTRPPRANTTTPTGTPPPRATEQPPRSNGEFSPGHDTALGSEAAPPIETETHFETEAVPWASGPQQKSRQRLLIGATLLGLLSTLSLLAFWLRSPSKESTTRVVQTEPAPDGSPATEIPATEIPTTGIPTMEPATASESLSNRLLATAGNDRVTPPVSTDPATVPNATVDPESSAVEPSTGTPAAGKSSPMIPAGLLPIDPLRGDRRGDDPRGPNDPRRLDAPRRPDVNGDDPDAVENPLVGLPPELEAFTRLLDMPGNAPDAPPMNLDDVDVPELRVDQAADVMIDPMMLATPPPQVNIDNALKLRVAIQSEGYPLSDFVLLSSELTRVPIQIDWVALDLINFSITQLVQDTQPGWKPIGDRLKRITASLGLMIEQQPDQLLITVETNQLKTQLQSVTTTDDFNAEQKSADELIAAFMKATQWNEREKAGLNALIADGLRLARGLPPRLNETTRRRWMMQSDYLVSDMADDELAPRWPLVDGGDSGDQLDTAITLAGFLRHAARLNQQTCLVNWQDARDRRLSPGQLVMPYAGDPAGTMLRKTLKPLGLSCRDAGNGIWWVGTDATYDRMPLLVIGDALGPQRQAILDRIELAAAQSGTEILLQHDPVSDRYLSLLPRFLYRQLPKILKPFR